MQKENTSIRSRGTEARVSLLSIDQNAEESALPNARQPISHIREI
jgi:hypothetical protein